MSCLLKECKAIASFMIVMRCFVTFPTSTPRHPLSGNTCFC